MCELTNIFPQIGWAVPQCHWPISRLWAPMMNFKQEEDFLRCKQATDTTSSMRCSPSVPFRLTYFSTRNSSTQVSASNPLLPFHFSCHDAQDKRRKRGENSAGTRCMKFTQGLPKLLLLLSCRTHRAALWERRRKEGRIFIITTRFCFWSVLKLTYVCHFPFKQTPVVTLPRPSAVYSSMLMWQTRSLFKI